MVFAAAFALAALPATASTDKRMSAAQSRVDGVGARLEMANAARCREQGPVAGGNAASRRCARRLIVTRDRTLNAWADGRQVAIARRLVDKTASDDELAFVLAHEMAHNLLDRALGPDARVSGFVAGGRAALPQAEVEAAADRLAVRMIAAAGFRPGEAEGLLRRLSPARNPAATHPDTAHRIALLRTAIAGLGDEAGDAPLPEAGSPRL